MKKIFANIKPWLLPAIIAAGLTSGIFLMSSRTRTPDISKQTDQLLKMIERSAQETRAAREGEIQAIKSLVIHLDEDRKEAKEELLDLKSQYAQIKKLGDEKINSIKHFTPDDIDRYLSEQVK